MTDPLRRLLDRCAEALYLAEIGASQLPWRVWSELAENVQDHCRRRARAVLETAASSAGLKLEEFGAALGLARTISVQNRAAATAPIDAARAFAAAEIVGDGAKSAAMAVAVAWVAAAIDANLDPWPYKFAPGEHVEKTGGSYELEGVVVARFLTFEGQPRYIVDHRPVAPGLLHIYAEPQLRPAAAPVPPAEDAPAPRSEP